MPKRTFQPNVKKFKKKQGFLKRMKTAVGRKILKRRKQKNRQKLSK